MLVLLLWRQLLLRLSLMEPVLIEPEVRVLEASR